MTEAEPPPGPQSGEPGADNKRIDLRQAVLKGAQIIFGGSVIDCLVINVSESGARVRTAAMTQVPEHVILRFGGGASFAGTRRWARGLEIGLSLARIASLADEAAELAWRLHDMVRATSVQEPLALLRARRFFDDLALRTAAEEAEAGLRRLESMLASRLGRPSRG
jgi:hypothetical protein